MTNQQLAILLEGYAGQLARAISLAELEADNFCQRTEVISHKSMLEVVYTPACWVGKCQNDGHYYASHDEQMIVQPLYAVLAQLQAQIAVLKGEVS